MELTRSRTNVTGLILKALSLVLGFYTLGRKSFWYDEGFSAMASSDGLSGAFDVARRLDSNMPLFALVLVPAIAHAANSSADVYKSSIAADFMVIAGTISAVGKGWAGAIGPGCFQPTASGSGPGGGPASAGGTHGGQGGAASAVSPYGSYAAPTQSGSGGGLRAVERPRQFFHGARSDKPPDRGGWGG